MRDRLSQHFRARRDLLLRDVIARAPRRGPTLRILDLGGRQSYRKRVGYGFLAEHKANVVLLNLAEHELAADPDGPKGMFAHAVGNACALDYADDTFDLCHSNSVIEHVGVWRDMKAFAGETRRVAASYYVQTPNFWFPVDPHFPRFPLNHWLPRPVRARLMRLLPLSATGRAPDMDRAYNKVDSARLLSKAQMETLFPEACMHAERLVGLPKSYTAVHIGEANR